MDISMDNNKTSDIDHVTQALLSNANNTEPKHEIDETNNIFGATDDNHHINDKLNNIIDLDTMSNPFANSVKVVGNENNVNVNIKGCLENDGDMGPETSVDTTDDADNDTDPYECSTLSHSKETLPSDNPFDKIGYQGFELDDNPVEDKPVSLDSPNTDMPFDSHANEVHFGVEPNNHFNDVGHADLKDQCYDFYAEHQDLHLGEDHFKTDVVKHEIIETEIETSQTTDNTENLDSVRKDVVDAFEEESEREAADLEKMDQVMKDTFEEQSERETAEMEKMDQLMRDAFEGQSERETDDLEKMDHLMRDAFEGQSERGAADYEKIDQALRDVFEQQSEIEANLEFKKGGDLVEHLNQNISELYGNEKQNKYVNIGCDKLDLLQTKNDLAYNQFAEYIEHPFEKQEIAMNETFVNNFGGTHEKTDLLDKNMKDQENKSSLIDTPSSISPVPLPSKLDTPASMSNFPGIENVSTSLNTDFDNMIPGDERGEQSKPQTKMLQAIHEKEIDLHEQHSDHEKDVYESSEKEKYLVEMCENEKITDKDIEHDKQHINRLLDNEDHVGEFHLPNATPVSTEHSFGFNDDTIQPNEQQIVNMQDFNMSQPIIESVTTTTTEVITEIIEINPISIANAFAQKPLEAEFEENHRTELLTEPEHLPKPIEESLQTNPEKPLTTIDDNLSDSQLQQHEQDNTKDNKLPSLESNEINIEAFDMQKEESGIVIDDIAEIPTKKPEDTINNESCDDPLDEWKYTKANVDKAEIASLDNIVESQETVAQIESQQPEELNIKEKEVEKVSADISVGEQPKENVEKHFSDCSLDKEVEDMTSKLNPDAKIFIPLSPPISFELTGDLLSSAACVAGDDDNVLSQSPPKGSFSIGNAISNAHKDIEEMADDATEIASGIPPQVINCLNGDDMVAQSPQKGTISMNDFPLPTASEFQQEIIKRPSELSNLDPPQNLNLKEAMHEPEKEQVSPMEQNDSSLNDESNIQSPLDDSLGRIEDMMNSVQVLPDNEEDSNKSNGSFIPEINANGDVPLITEVSNLKPDAEETGVEETVVKSRAIKTSKAADSKKLDTKAKPSSIGPKKAVSSTSATLSDGTKTKTSATTSKTKVSAGLTARPRTAPAPSSKPTITEKKPSTNVISARAKPDTKSSPIGLKKLPLTKPKTEETKSAVRQVANKVASTARNATTLRTASATSTTTNTVTKRTTTVSTTNSTASKPATGARSTLPPIAKNTTPITSTHKPAISPRSTVTSTMRKTEALKSPTASTKASAVNKAGATTANSSVTKTTSRTKTTTSTALKKSTPSTATKNATNSAPPKKPTPIKRPSATLSTDTKIAALSETSDIKMNGNATAITTNGENKD